MHKINKYKVEKWKTHWFCSGWCFGQPLIASTGTWRFGKFWSVQTYNWMKLRLKLINQKIIHNNYFTTRTWRNCSVSSDPESISSLLSSFIPREFSITSTTAFLQLKNMKIKYFIINILYNIPRIHHSFFDRNGIARHRVDKHWKIINN